MKINKDQLKLLADLPDKALWQAIRDMAKSRGYELPEGEPSASEMNQIRAAMRSSDKINLPMALGILKNLKRGK